jgi:hypothetical protein
MALSSGHKSISRVDHRKRHMHGWYVRVIYKGVTHSRFFNDSLCGGRRAALAEAIEWRNETEREVGKPRTERLVVSVNARNKSGVIGVRRVAKRAGRQRRGPVYYEYAVQWSPEPKMRQTACFSVKKYGEKEAFRLACEFRKQKEAEMYGQNGQNAAKPNSVSRGTLRPPLKAPGG